MSISILFMSKSWLVTFSLTVNSWGFVMSKMRSTRVFTLTSPKLILGTRLKGAKVRMHSSSSLFELLDGFVLVAGDMENEGPYIVIS